MCGRVACMARGCAWQGVCVLWGLCVAGETATAADGMHPPGMHSCYHLKTVAVWLIINITTDVKHEFCKAHISKITVNIYSNHRFRET